MYDALGYSRAHPNYTTARRAIEKLLVVGSDEAYCQPCVSPVWDTALACHALLDVGSRPAMNGADAGLKWLRPLQVLDLAGDWTAQRPHVRPGGWAFQYANALLPRSRRHRRDRDGDGPRAKGERRARLSRPRSSAAANGPSGLQSRNGGWGAFDADNNYGYLNNIPFSDHGALLDPPTEDLTGRCVSMLAQLGESARDLRARCATASPFSVERSARTEAGTADGA